MAWLPPPQGQSVQEFLASIPVVTRGDHPEIRQALREQRIRRLVAAAAALAAAAAALVAWMH